MNKIRKIIGCVALCMAVTAQTAFAEQMQVVFYGKTTAYKQISVLALDKDLPGSEIKEQNIKYINQVSSDADGNYSMIFPFDADGSGYVFRSNETGMFRQIEVEGQTLYVSESGSDLNDGSEGSPFQTLNRAFSMAVSGVNTTIVLKRNAEIKSLPSLSSGSITIEGDNGSRVLTLPETLECNSDIKLDKIKLTKSTLFANGHKLEIGNEVTFDDRLTVYGGCNKKAYTGDTNVELYGGKYSRVYGG